MSSHVDLPLPRVASPILLSHPGHVAGQSATPRTGYSTYRQVNLLLHATPSAAEQADDEGSLPLHVAARSAASPAVVKALLKRFPAAARRCDDSGGLPLHVALGGYAVTSGLARYTSAPISPLTHVIPHRSRLSLMSSPTDLASHLSISHRSRLSPLYLPPISQPDQTVATLLEAFIDGAKVRDSSHMLPLDLALESGASDRVLAGLIAADMPVARMPSPALESALLTERGRRTPAGWGVAGVPPTLLRAAPLPCASPTPTESKRGPHPPTHTRTPPTHDGRSGRHPDREALLQLGARGGGRPLRRCGAPSAGTDQGAGLRLRSARVRSLECEEQEEQARRLARPQVSAT